MDGPDGSAARFSPVRLSKAPSLPSVAAHRARVAHKTMGQPKQVFVGSLCVIRLDSQIGPYSSSSMRSQSQILSVSLLIRQHVSGVQRSRSHAKESAARYSPFYPLQTALGGKACKAQPDSSTLEPYC